MTKTSPWLVVFALLGCAGNADVSDGAVEPATDLGESALADLESARPAVTTLRVHYPLPASGSLSVRGSLSPLSWTSGATMTQKSDTVFELQVRGLKARSRGPGSCAGGWLRAGAPQQQEGDADHEQGVGDVEARPDAAPGPGVAPGQVDADEVDDAGAAELVGAEAAVVQVAEGAREDHGGADDAGAAGAGGADQPQQPHAHEGGDDEQPPRAADVVDDAEGGALVVGEVELEHPGPQDERATGGRAQVVPGPLLAGEVEGEGGRADAGEEEPAAGAAEGLLVF